MKNHKRIHNYFKAHLLLLFLICCSCLPNIPVAKIPDSSFHLSNNVSIVFGRLEVINNGRVIKPVPSKLLGPVSGPPAPSVIGIKKALTNEAIKRFYTDFDPDFFVDYYVRVDRDDGYFMVVLPPGRYYVEEVQTKIEGMETLKYLKNNIPYIINFDISPGVATYVGTIQLSTIEGWQIKSEFKEAKKIFNSLFPAIEMAEGLGEIVNASQDDRRTKIYSEIPIITPLSQFKIAHLNVSSTSNDKSNEAAKLEQTIDKSLVNSALFDKIIQGAVSSDEKVNLLINAKLTETETLIIDVELIDLITGNKIGLFTVQTDRNYDYASKLIVDVLRKNSF